MQYRSVLAFPLLALFAFNPAGMAAPGPKCSALGRFRRDHLRDLAPTEASVLTARGAAVWQDAADLAALCAATDILDRMLQSRKSSRDLVADALPEYLMRVYTRNPGFYLRRALKANQDNMDAVVSAFASQLTDHSLAVLEAPAREIAPTSPEYPLARRFLESTRKLERESEWGDVRRAELCEQSVELGRTVTFTARTHCSNYDDSSLMADDYFCLKMGPREAVLKLVVTFDNPLNLDLGGCGARRAFVGRFERRKSLTATDPEQVIFRIEGISNGPKSGSGSETGDRRS